MLPTDFFDRIILQSTSTPNLLSHSVFIILVDSLVVKSNK